MNLTYDDSTVYIILFLVAFIASAIDAIAGGGGLLVVPTMLVLGLNPLTALGTNKLQSCFGTATSSINYYKNNLLKEKNIKLLKKVYFLLKEQGMTIKGVKRILDNKEPLKLDEISNQSIKAEVLKNKLVKISNIIRELKETK